MPAPWITVNDTVAPLDPIAPWAVSTASWILYHLTGKKYEGLQTITEFYSQDSYLFNQYGAKVIDGQMYNLPVKSSSEGLINLRLRNSPVISVTSVKLRGQLIPTTDYQLRNNAYLVRKNKTPWILDPINELEITYTYGNPPPIAGKMAAIRLANEFIWNELDDERCSLPERISSSVSRQGVDYTILDPMEFLDKGKLGIPTIDFFIATANPSRAKRKPRIVSPDTPRGERVN